MTDVGYFIVAKFSMFIYKNTNKGANLHEKKFLSELSERKAYWCSYELSSLIHV
jgi:hypothetical protein